MTGINDPELLKKLLAIPEKQPRGSKPKKGPNAAIRNVETWFKLDHILLDPDLKDRPECDNPNCEDPRPRDKGQVVVVIAEQRMCRYCFMSGWLTENPNQIQLST
jgi:hypothetical protein